MLWNRSFARAALMGHEPTHNPSPAAAHLLGRAFGKKRVARAVRKEKRRRRSAHRGNPIPALVAIGAGLLKGKLGARLQSRDARDAARFARADALAQRASLGDAAALKELTALSTGFATQKAKDYAAMKLAEVVHAHVTERLQTQHGVAVASEAKQARREAQLAGVLTTGLQAVASRGRALRRAPVRRRSYAGRY